VSFLYYVYVHKPSLFLKYHVEATSDDGGGGGGGCGVCAHTHMRAHVRLRKGIPECIAPHIV